MTDTPTDDAGGHQLPECFGPPPSDLHFPLYGLSDTFTGERFLFQWERLFGMDRPAPNPVAWVALVHRSDTRLLEVITFGKQPWTTFGQHESKVDLTSVAYQALFDHLQLVVTKMPLGEVRSKYQTEQLQVIQRLADDLTRQSGNPCPLLLQEWRRTRSSTDKAEPGQRWWTLTSTWRSGCAASVSNPTNMSLSSLRT